MGFLPAILWASSTYENYVKVSLILAADQRSVNKTVVWCTSKPLKSYHEQGFLHPLRPATFQPPGFLIAGIHFVSSASQQAPYQSNIACGRNPTRQLACHLQRLPYCLTWKKSHPECWVPVCFEVILSISDQTGVPLDHDTIHRSRSLYDTI